MERNFESMETLDLNIDNYNLNDLLNLFNLPMIFNADDLKRAKQMVLKTHPDKCNLSKEYFLFFSKAYRMIHQIYTIRNPAIKEAFTQRQDRDYISPDGKRSTKLTYNNVIAHEGYTETYDHADDYDGSKQMKKMVERIMSERYQQTNPSYPGSAGQGGGKNNGAIFNEWFNEKFEKFKVKDDERDTGYGDWLRKPGTAGNRDGNNNNGEDGEDDEYSEHGGENIGGGWDDKVRYINAKKQALRNKYALIQHTAGVATLDEACGGSGYDLTRERPQEYSSGIFGTLRYEDLKKAHTETVIPVTDEDFHNVKQHRNINELQMFRDMAKRTYDYSDQTAKQQFEYQQRQRAEQDTNRAYNLIRQDEVAREMSKHIKQEFLQLGYNKYYR